MKKLMTLALCILVCVWLYGCGCDNAAETKDPSTTGSTEQTTEATTEESTQQTADWEAEIDVLPDESQPEETKAQSGEAGQEDPTSGDTNQEDPTTGEEPSVNDTQEEPEESTGSNGEVGTPEQTEPEQEATQGRTDSGAIELPRIPG